MHTAVVLRKVKYAHCYCAIQESAVSEPNVHGVPFCFRFLSPSLLSVLFSWGLVSDVDTGSVHHAKGQHHPGPTVLRFGVSMCRWCRVMSMLVDFSEFCGVGGCHFCTFQHKVRQYSVQQEI